MPSAKKEKMPTMGSSSSSAFAPPPPVDEQKRLRKEDLSITPPPPYLWVSKVLDICCDDVPLLKNACPDAAAGGWRSKLPYPEWGTFPRGKLSHSFHATWASMPGEKMEDVTFEEYVRSSGGSGDSNDGISATLNNYYHFAFHTNNTTLGDITHPSSLVVLFVLVLLVRAFKRAFLPRFSELGRRLGQSAHGPGWEDVNADRISKFGEYVYRLLYHSSVSLYGLWYFRDKAWWDDSRGGTANLWLEHGWQPIEPGMAWYFLVQSAYNVDALVSIVELSFEFEFVNPLALYSSALQFLDREHVVHDDQRKREVFKMMVQSCPRTILWTPLFQLKWSPMVRGDFREMLAHHLVTNALIFLSSYCRFTRTGSMVFLVHDVSDVPVDLSKLANFVKWKVTTIACFVTMVVTWIATRLYLYPFVICRSAWWEAYDVLVVNGRMDPAFGDAVHPLFKFLFSALLFLHVTWFLILLRIGWTLVSKGETHDYSEHKGGEKDGKDVS